MKQTIHPQYYDDCKVTCTCGNKFTTGSTATEIKVEICSACHPLFTGEMKYVDTKGRIERFQEKREAGKNWQKKSKKKKRRQQKVILSLSRAAKSAKKNKKKAASA